MQDQMPVSAEQCDSDSPRWLCLLPMLVLLAVIQAGCAPSGDDTLPMHDTWLRDPQLDRVLLYYYKETLGYSTCLKQT